jgi:hypothetical protein
VKQAGLVAHIACGILVGRPEGKRRLGPSRRWVDYIKMDIREIGWDHTDWIDLARFCEGGNES